MNAEMRTKLGITDASGIQLEDLLTVGSKIFFQTHFYPLIKMQQSVREIFLTFKGVHETIPVLLNVEVEHVADGTEIHCGGMEISKRNRFEKELIEAKKTAEDALEENLELQKVRNDLMQHQKILESQYRKLTSLKEQQQELFKLIAHDLQEPLRKSIFFSDYLLTGSEGFSSETVTKLESIKRFSSDMRRILLTLQRFHELENSELNFSKISLAEAISEAIELTEINSADTEVHYPKTEHFIFGDKHLLVNLFSELLRDSQKNRNPSNEKLTIEISAIETEKNVFLESKDKYLYERFLKVTYTDNGLGFTTDTAKMFKIVQKSVHFNQISMGLAFAKRIVEKHFGNIVAKSVKGKGVGYTILFPKTVGAKTNNDSVT